MGLASSQLVMRMLAAAVLFGGMSAPLTAAGTPAWTITLHGLENRPSVLALVGGRAVWAVRTTDGAVEFRTSVGGGIRRVYRAALPAAPPDAPTSFYRTTIDQAIEAIDGDRAHVAFLRRVSLVRTPKCVEASPPCRAPSFREPWAAQVLVGTLRGRFRVVAEAKRADDPCVAVPTVLAARGSAVVYATEAPLRRGCIGANAAARVVLLTLTPRPRARVLEAVQGRPGSVAFAGRHVAWSTVDCACVVIYDLGSGRSGRVRVGDRYADSLHLQPDGKLVFVSVVHRRLGATLCGREEIGYVANGGRTPRFLGWPAHLLAGFAGNRVVYVGGPRADCTGSHPRLVTQRLGTRPRTLPRSAFALVGAAFDGSRLLTATAFGNDTVLRLEPLP